MLSQQELSGLLLPRLREAVRVCDYHIEDTKRAQSELAGLQQKLKDAKLEQEYITTTVLYLKKMRKDLTEYNAEKKEKALAGIYTGIYSAKSVVPDAGAVQLQVSGNGAHLINENGCNIELIEGDAVQSLLSFFVRNICLRNSTNTMSDLIMDELFAPLSPDTSARLSQMLDILSRDQLIILIEQKNEIFSNVDYINYQFMKVDGITRVKRVDE